MRHMKAPHASPCLVREAWELLQAPPGEGQGPAVLGWQVQVVALLQEEATAFATWQAAKNGDNAFCVEEVHLPGGGGACVVSHDTGDGSCYTALAAEFLELLVLSALDTFGSSAP